MKLVIDRSKWLRGEGPSRLVDEPTGKMCCLGFFGCALGATKAKLIGNLTPAQAINKKSFQFPEWLLSRYSPNYEGGTDSQIAEQLMRINDLPQITDAERESELASIFAQHGVEVEFIDGGAE